MADEQIDSLSIAISVKDNDSAKKIKGITDAIDSLVSSLKGLESVQGALKTLENSLGAIGRSSKSISSKTKKVFAQAPQMATATEGVKGGSLPQIAKQTKTEINGLTKNLKENKKEAEKGASSFNKFTRAVGRIALYRMIRTALKEITQAAREGLSNLSTVDKNLANSMNRLSASATTLKNVFASALSPIIKNIEPVITKFADTLATIINRYEEAKAAMQGASTYTRILTSDTEEYKKSLDRAKGSLLSFDTFNILSSNKQYTGVIEDTVKLTQGEAKGIVAEIDNITNALTGLIGVISIIKLAEIASGIIKVKNAFVIFNAALVGGVLISIANAVEAFKNGDIYGGILATTVGISLATALILLNKEMLKTVGIKIVQFFQNLRLQSALATTSMQKLQLAAGAVFVGITALAMGITSFISSWSDMSVLKKILTIFIALAAAITATAIALHLFYGNWAAALGIGAAVAGGVLLVSSSIPNFANGGSFNTADMFYANENGQTELIASTNNGGAVMNMEQLQGAIYNGMIMAMADSGGKEIVLKVDQNTLGRVVANSTGFISETNRIKLIKV